MGCDEITTVIITIYNKFQFTHPVWGATLVRDLAGELLAVSIHAPRVGCDLAGQIDVPIESLFQFTHPVWGATGVGGSEDKGDKFQFTHPVWGATGVQTYDNRQTQVSIHAPRVGCD